MTKRNTMAEISFGLVVGTFGAALGAIGAAIVNSFGGKAESRANAADRVATAASRMIDRMEKRDIQLDGENKELRRTLVRILDMIDDVGPMTPLDPKMVARLKKEARVARDAL